MTRRIIPGARPYFLAILSALAALLLRKMLSPVLGADNPYLTAWAAIVLSAWYYGVGPAIVCTLLTIIGVWYWFLPYSHSFVLENPKTEISGMLLFSLLSILIIALGEVNRKSKARSERDAAERSRIEDVLRGAQAQLESRVQERTAALNVAHQKLSLEAATVKAQAEWLDAANDAIFVGGSEETITYWNKGAERLYGWAAAEAIGKDAHDLLHTVFPVPFAEIARQREQGGWQGELVHTRRDGTTVTVASRWTPVRDARGNFTGWLEINRDITDRKVADAARQLNAELMKLQDEERRRIARELHDSAGQTIVALILNLGQLKASANLSREQTRLLSESYGLLQNVNSELCAISHVLHPLLLDELGLCTALEWYVEGFRQRTGIAATLERDPGFEPLNAELDVAIFRVVQECLTNLHRHSGCPEVTVRLLRSSVEVRLELKDRGRILTVDKRLSVPDHAAMGAGFRGMRERILHLGGNLTIATNAGGTTIAITFPAPKADASNNELAIA